jgi:arylsulfatase A-like enzyme
MNNSSKGRDTSPSSPYRNYTILVLLLLITFYVVKHAGGSGSSSEPGPPTAGKPNILLIVADDLGNNDLAINNNNTAMSTPNMDRIAREGVRFTRHYAHTVCSPARAALLTGLYPERLGFLPNGRGISPDVVTLPERLQAEGYTTWHIGKWHIGDLDRAAWPDRQGFDHWFGFLNQWRLAGEHTPDGVIQLSDPRYNDPWLDSDSEPGKNFPGHLENILTDKAIGVLTDLNKAHTPWFLNLWFYAPHGPIQPAAEFAKNYPATPAGRYQALVNQLDYNIGRIISHLATIGALQNTIIVIVSDNGGTNHELDNNAPFAGNKTTLMEGGLRTPLIIRWPEQSINGQVFSNTVSIADIYPTLLESIGVAPPVNIDGNSFYRSVQHLEPPHQKALFWDLGAVSYGALSADGRWRLYQRPKTWGVIPKPALFDLELDPTGAQQLRPRPETELAQITQSYQAWYKDVHTVRTSYVPTGDGGGVLTGMDFLRTPGFDTYTFGIGIPGQFEGPIATQEGIWRMSRTGNTVTAQFGELTLAGDIENANSCHSIVVSGNFSRQVQSGLGPDVMALTLYIDGVQAQSGHKEATLHADDLSVDTIIGNPDGTKGGVKMSSPVILNTALDSTSPWTLQAFSEHLCGGN